ncbi:Haloacid dehalogenase-like hydrolase-domain-containing protein [Aspergillus pseudocaelatus]|uniref:Haloacid dehalogenase-like hydrolase-domain-containing protein n=1 Tax=Aspergillus pseudocaelatus TaxID=1825620 RepID=A0ABQ6WFL1_9EURO|nr:Haloacid dehalogenase-like hydrolase-domain-containing protein [Aspergillus pseudocaelatus]
MSHFFSRSLLLGSSRACYLSPRPQNLSPSLLTRIGTASFSNTSIHHFRKAMSPSNDATSAGSDSRPVFFFDIDNCLYSRKCNIHDEMQKLIHRFFVKHLSLNGEDAHMLHKKYYTEYGLAIEGLTRHHKIDPLQFNSEVDDTLPLDTILKPDPQLRKLLEDIDRSKVRLWLLTNAYVTHGKRVVKLLGVDDQFEGITFCDYGQLPLVCKPTQEMYAKAEREANVPSTAERYFVDDSGLNCKHAAARGWQTAHLVEPGLALPETPVSQYMIRSLEELRTCFPHLFKTSN